MTLCDLMNDLFSRSFLVFDVRLTTLSQFSLLIMSGLSPSLITVIWNLKNIAKKMYLFWNNCISTYSVVLDIKKASEFGILLWLYNNIQFHKNFPTRFSLPNSDRITSLHFFQFLAHCVSQLSFRADDHSWGLTCHWVIIEL